MKKVTVQAPANIAFIKYWGNTEDNLPLNTSISMTLSHCQTITTVDVSNKYTENRIELSNEDGSFNELSQNTIKGKKAYEQIERIQHIAGSKEKVRVKSRNSFPSDAGIASSASGFCALTAGLLLAYGLNDIYNNTQELSKLVRLSGSGSAARSVYGGFGALLAGTDHGGSYAVQLADEHHWPLTDIIAIVQSDPKTESSSAGHRIAPTSPYFRTRLQEMQNRIRETEVAIQEKNINQLGSLSEQDTISMHAVMMTSQPPLYYWEPGTIAVMKAVMQWRTTDGLQSYFTIDAGANVHVICEKKDATEVEKRLKQLSVVRKTIYNEPAPGVHPITDHLF